MSKINSFHFLEEICLSVFRKFSHLSNARFFFVKLAIITTFLSLFFGFPSYDKYIEGGYQDVWEVRQEQIESPFTPTEIENKTSHEAKLAFRFSVPLVLYLLHLPVEAAHFVQYVFLFLLFYWLGRLSYDITKDKVLTILVTSCFSFIYVGSILYTDIRGNFDVVAYALLTLSMVTRNPFLITFCVVGAGFTDERGLIATGIVFVFYLITLYDKTKQEGSLIQLLKPNQYIYAIIAGWVIYFSIRLSLQTFWGLNTPSEGTNLLIDQGNMWFFGIWTGLESLWLPVLLSLLVLWKMKKHMILVLYGIVMLTVLTVALSVADITRSVAYIFPAFFIALIVIKDFGNQKQLRIFFTLILFLSLFPTYYASGEKMIIWIKPLPVQIIRWLAL